MMFDPPDYPYKELQDTYEAHIFNHGAEQTIPAGSISITGVTEHIIQSEENQSFHSNDSGRYFNIENSFFQDVPSNMAEQNLFVVQSENLFNYEPTLLDENTVNQFLLPLQESSDTLKVSNNNGPDVLALHSCIVCHEIFTTEADLLDHTISVHTSEAGELDQTLTPTDSAPNNVIHTIQSGETSGTMNFETEWLVCRICERVLSTALEIEPTEQLCCIVENEKGSVLSRKLHTMYVCDYCSGLFADGDALDRHRLTCILEDHTRYHNDIDVSPSAQYTDICFNCDACGQRCSSSEELKFHTLQCPSPATRSSRRSYSSTSTNKMWNCGSCNQLFTTARELYRHKRGEDRPPGAPLMAYVCEDCDKVLGSMCALHTHKKMHKVSKPGYPCRVCGRRFNQSGHLAIHMRMHTGERPYPCDLCPKAFKVKVERDDHRRTHTGERPFACAACPKTFTAAARLREHARIHTDHRPYRCDICGAAFRRPYARTVHTLIHTGAKPHECDVCGTAFRRSGDMWKHKRTLHGVQAGAENVPKTRN